MLDLVKHFEHVLYESEMILILLRNEFIQAVKLVRAGGKACADLWKASLNGPCSLNRSGGKPCSGSRTKWQS